MEEFRKVSEEEGEKFRAACARLKEEAENIFFIVVTLLTSHPPMSPSKPELPGKPQNVFSILVTLLVSQASGWLKASVFANVPYSDFTLLVSQTSGWLKSTHLSKVLSIHFTLLESHPPMSSLK